MSLLVRFSLLILSGEMVPLAHVEWAGWALLVNVPFFLAITAPTIEEDGSFGWLPAHRVVLLSFIPQLVAGLHVWGLMEIGWLIYYGEIVYLSLTRALFGSARGCETTCAGRSPNSTTRRAPAGKCRDPARTLALRVRLVK